MPKSNAERQREYRARKASARNGRNAPEPAIAVTPTEDGDAPGSRDYRGADGLMRLYLGNWGYGPVFALDVSSGK